MTVLPKLSVTTTAIVLSLAAVALVGDAVIVMVALWGAVLLEGSALSIGTPARPHSTSIGPIRVLVFCGLPQWSSMQVRVAVSMPLFQPRQ